MESEQFTPVSILKKPRVTGAVNSGIRKVVVISNENSEHASDDLRSNVSEPESEDSAVVIVKEDEDSMDVSVTPGTPGSVADRERRKWVENAVPLSHNPYSKENIEGFH